MNAKRPGIEFSLPISPSAACWIGGRSLGSFRNVNVIPWFEEMKPVPPVNVKSVMTLGSEWSASSARS